MPLSFEDLVDMIQREYNDLGHQKDWRFLTVPRRTFDSQPGVAFITLNPGGDGPDLSQGRESCEYGFAYLREAWGKKEGSASEGGKSPLQVQVRKLLEDLRHRLRPDMAEEDFLDHEILGGYYVPFRSPSLPELVNRVRSFEFARRLWGHVLSRRAPRLIVTIDRIAFGGIRDILTADPSMSPLSSRDFRTGWGLATASVSRVVSAAGEISTIARFPHLSSYKIFSRDACKPHIAEILEYALEQKAS